MSDAVGSGLALAFTPAAALGIDKPGFGVPLVAALAAMFLLLLPYFVFAAGHVPSVGRAQVWFCAMALLLPYLVYGLGTGALAGEAFARLLAFVTLPTAILLLARSGKTPGFWDVVAVLAIWLPFDFRLLEGIWIWPEGQGSYGYQVVLAVDLAVLLFVGFRGVEGVRYSFRLARADAAPIFVNFLVLSAIAIPLGIQIGFIAYQPRAFDMVAFLGSFLVILIFIGVPEELLFRGLIQNFLEKRWGRGWPALFAAASIFGAAHLNNGDAPNWKYAFMATIAGVFYGRAFRQSGAILAPALVHALVDAVWRAFFR